MITGKIKRFIWILIFVALMSGWLIGVVVGMTIARTGCAS